MSKTFRFHSTASGKNPSDRLDFDPALGGRWQVQLRETSGKTAVIARNLPRGLARRAAYAVRAASGQTVVIARENS
jgi:hypothetical protein